MTTGLAAAAAGTLGFSSEMNATLAFIATLFIILALLLAGTVGRQVPAPWQDLLFALALPPRLNDFAKGVIDTRHIVYFLSMSGLCWSVATSLVAWKRWRDR